MKVIYTTTTTEKNYCLDRSRLRGIKTQVGSNACAIDCPFCYNEKDMASRAKGIILCANDDSVILTTSQYRQREE